MATHCSILAWRTPWTEEAGGLQSAGCKELDTTELQHDTGLILEAKTKEEAGAGRPGAFSLAAVPLKFLSCP